MVLSRRNDAGARARTTSPGTACHGEARTGAMSQLSRIPEPIRRLAWPPADAAEPDALVTREWLVTNGLGGYASGTVAGVITRRYHGVLIAALPAPYGRTVMLSHVAEELHLADGRCYEFGGRERTGGAPGVAL